MSNVTVYSKEKMFKLLSNDFQPVEDKLGLPTKVECGWILNSFDITSSHGRYMLSQSIARFIIDYFGLTAEISVKISQDFVEYLYGEYKIRILSL